MARILTLMHHTEIPLLFGAQTPLVHTRAMAMKEPGVDYQGGVRDGSAAVYRQDAGYRFHDSGD